MIALVCGFIYILVADREYSASVKLRVDLQKTDLLPSPSVATTFLNIETAFLEGDVELARSMSVLRSAARSFNLDGDPDYNRISLIAGLRANVLQLIRVRQEQPEKRSQTEELRPIQLANRTRIDRVGQSLLIRFTYRSTNPARAAHVANVIAESFVDVQPASQKETISTLTASLHDRLDLMRHEVIAGDTAVARYKADHVLAEPAGGSELERQFVELNNQAAAANAEATNLRIRFQRLNAALEMRDADSSTGLQSGDQAISALETELKRAIGQTDHVASGRAKENIQNMTRALIGNRRIAVEFAESRADQLAMELERVKRDVTKNAIHHVELAELRRHADSRRVIYDATLTAFNRFVQNEALPVARFKIAEAALPPALPHWPKTPLIMASMLLLGLSVGSGFILLHEGLRQTFMSPRETRRVLGIKSIPAPKIALAPVINFDCYANALSAGGSRMRDSMFSLQRALGVGLSGGGLVVGVTSGVEHEGKTSITGLLGAHLASLGMRVLLIDLVGESWSERRAEYGDPSRQLNVEPADRHNASEFPEFINRVTDNVHLLNEDSAGLLHGTRSVFRRHISSLRNSYDVVLVDLPVFDQAQHLAQYLDKTVLVVEWNRTTHEQLVELLESGAQLANKLS